MSVSPSSISDRDVSTATDHGDSSSTKYIVDNLANPETSENGSLNERPPNVAQVNVYIIPYTIVIGL